MTSPNRILLSLSPLSPAQDHTSWPPSTPPPPAPHSLLHKHPTMARAARAQLHHAPLASFHRVTASLPTPPSTPAHTPPPQTPPPPFSLPQRKHPLNMSIATQALQRLMPRRVPLASFTQISAPSPFRSLPPSLNPIPAPLPPPTPPLNPIPDAIPSLPAYRPLRLLQPLLTIAHASLLIQRLRKTSTRLQPTITPRQLEDRVRFFLVRFRIHINRRYRDSQRSKHLRALCSGFIALHPPSSKISRSVCKVAKEALLAAPNFPAINQAWWRVRNSICKSNLNQKECAPGAPWPLPSNPSKSQDINILFWNVNGGHLLEHKRTLLSQTSEELKLDIIALVEIKTPSTAPPIPTFNTCSFRRSLQSSTNHRSIAGGICIGKSPSPDVTARTTLVFDGFIEAIATTLKSPQMTLTLITAYIPPISSSTLRGKFEDSTFLTQLRSLYRNHTGEKQPLLLIADTNADISNMTGKGAKTLRQLMREGWEIRSSPDLPTYLGSLAGSCIDVVLTRNLPYRLRCDVVPMSTTDHQALHIVLSTKTSGRALTPNTCNRYAAKRFAVALETADHPLYTVAQDILTSSLTGHLPPPIPPLHDGPAPETDTSTQTLHGIIKCINTFEAAEKLTPFTPSDPLYLELKRKLRAHYIAIRRYRYTHSHRGLSTTLRQIRALKTEIQQCTHLIMERNSTEEATKVYETAARSKNLSAISRRIEKSFSPGGAVLNINNLSPEESSNHSRFWTERWGQEYSLPAHRRANLRTFLNSPPQNAPLPFENPSPRFTPFSITHDTHGLPWLTTAEEVETAIRRLSNNKAPGISGLPLDFFKLTQQFHQDLTFIFNDIICDQRTPYAFSECRLILLFKAGIISDPKNYRPINLTDSTFRIFESLLRTRMQAWAESSLHHDQYGFRAAQSTMSALLIIITSLHAAIAAQKPVVICFLDAVKAFDRVPHAAILEALMNHGLCPSSCRLLKAVISGHVSCIMDPSDPERSIRIAVECGVLQGGILSPFFFSCFSDSFFDHPLLSSQQVLYADDRTIMDEDPARVQTTLSALEEWASTRNLVHDGNEFLAVNTPTVTLKIHGAEIPRVQTAKCLGVHISGNGDVSRQKLIMKASFNAIKISATWKQASHRIPFSSLRDLICRYFLPTSIYGSAFFTEDVGKSLDKFIYQILRQTLRTHPSTNTLLMLEFTGIIRPTVRIQQETVSVLCRMLKNSSPSVQRSIITQFDLRLPFALKATKLLADVSCFPICGPSLGTRLYTILEKLRQHDLALASIVPPPDPPPYIPLPPSDTHMLAFTDGSTNSDNESGCAVICLIGSVINFSSYYLPGITENNAAELSALDLLLDTAATLKNADFPNLQTITIVTDSLNCVTSTHCTSLIKDPIFVNLLHSIQKKIFANNFKIFTKWVKAHDDTNASPFNQQADQWSSRSIATKQPLTSTLPSQPLDISQATLPLPWNKAETFPSTIHDQASLLHTIASNSILLVEDAHYRQSLHRYIPSNHSNFPGTGSIALSTSSIPGANNLFQLRRDPAQHYADHSEMRNLDVYWYRNPCPWCREDCLPSNFHLLCDCSLVKITPIDRRKILKSRQAILSGAAPTDWPNSTAMNDYLTLLTSSVYSHGKNPDHSNAVVKHQARIVKIFHKWRALCPASIIPDHDIPDAEDDADFGMGRERGGAAAPPHAKFHTGPAARLLILDRLEACRSVSEFDSCVTFYGKTLDRLSTWAAQSQRPFFRPTYFRQWLGRIEAYLTLANCPTHPTRRQAYVIHEAQANRAYHKSTAPLPPVPAPRPGRKTVHSDFPDWLPKMSKISKLVCRSLLHCTPANPSDATRNSRPSTSKNKGLKAAHHRTVSSPHWSFSLNWSLLRSTPLVEAWLAAPTSIQQRELIGPAWPPDWPKTTVIQSRKKQDPNLYERQTLAGATNGPTLLFLYDLIREALLSGELTTTPPFPLFTAEITAKQAQGLTFNYSPYAAAAVKLIFIPIDIWRQQGVTFFINPINITKHADLPASIIPLCPRLDVYTRILLSLQLPATECIAEAAEWASDQMESGRLIPRHYFPILPPDIPGSSTASLPRSEHQWDFDDDADTGSSDCSSGSDS